MKRIQKGFKPALIYIIIGMIWIVVSDNMERPGFAITMGPAMFNTLKGLAFVLFTGLLLAALINSNNRQNASLIESLQKKENEMRLLLNNTEEHFILTDNNLKIVSFNKKFKDGYKKLLNKDVKQGDSIMEYSQPARRDILKDIYRKVLQGEAFEDELTINLPNNEQQFFVNHYKPAIAAGGEIIGAFITSSDVTERKKNQHLFAVSEERFRALVENAIDMISLTDENGGIIYISPAFEKILGYTLEELKGRSTYDITHPDHTSESQRSFKDLLSRPGESVPRINRFLHKSGDYVWVEGTARNLLHDKNVNAIVANYRNITDRKLAEREKEFDTNNLHALINNTNDLMWSISNDNKLITSNQAFDDMVQYMSGNRPVKGEPVSLGFAAEQLKHWEDLYVRAFSGETFTIVEYTELPEELWSEISFYPISKGNEIVGTACYSRNITERKKFERDLEKSNRELIDIKKEMEYNEARLKQAQAIAHVGNWEVNLATNISIWSDEAYRIYGFDPGSHKLSVQDWMLLIHPDDLASVKKEIEKAESTLKPYTLNHRIIRKDGEVRHINSETRFEFDTEGMPVALYGVIHDITDSVNAEEEVKQSHKLLKKLTDNLPLAIYQFEVDKEGNMAFPFMSAGIQRILPSTSIEKLKTDARALFSSAFPEGIDELTSSIEESRKNLTNWDLEFNLRDANDKLVWLRGSSRPEKKENSDVTWYGYLQDITDRKNADENIRIAKERYDIVIRATNEAIWDWDLTTDKLHWGEGFRSLFGYAIEKEVVSSESWVSHIHPDDKAGIEASISKVINSKDEIQWSDEYRYVRADGSFADVLDRGFLIRSEAGKPLRMIGAMQDITERKLAAEKIRVAKERYDMVAKATNDAIYDWDLKTGEVIRTGDGLKILFGYGQEETRATDFWKSKVHPDDVEESYSKLATHLIDPDATICAQEYRFQKADGTYAYVYDKGFIIRNKEGEAIRLIGATQDISHQKETEIVLKKLNIKLKTRAEELARSNEELEQFAYIASHDLQEPLRMVSSFLTRLENKYKEQLDEKAKQYIFFATDGAERMRRIILDLLEYSRTGKNDVPEIVNTNDVLYEAVQLNKAVIEEKQALIEWDQLPSLRVSKPGLQQVFQNLISNSLKYQKANEIPVIKITCHETETHWQFSFADNGIGIEARFFDKIFIVFQRLHNRTEYSGTGIGLAICKKIVESHNGKIWVESTPLKGSTFHFSISKEQ